MMLKKGFFLGLILANLYANEPALHRLNTKHFPLQEETLTGDWSGAREKLEEKGISITGSYTTDIITSVTGGHARGISRADSWGASVHLDVEKAWGWSGGELFTSIVWRTGTSLSQRKIHNQFPVQQVYGSQTIKLNELYVGQSFFRDFIKVKLGRLDAGNDFLQSPLYNYFVNNAFNGNPISIFFNTGFSAYPNATWGGYLQTKLSNHFVFRGGVYNVNDQINANRYHGLNFTFKSTQGVIWIGQLDYLMNPDQPYRGNYRIGYFYQTGQIPKFSGGNVQGDPCVYLLLDQTVYESGKYQKLTPFCNFVMAPKDRNLLPFFFCGGAVWEGFWDARPHDSLSLGCAYGSYSADLRAAQRSKQLAEQHAETVLEVNYWLQINEYCTMVPDLQYIIRPSGLMIPNAFCLGVQIGFVL